MSHGYGGNRIGVLELGVALAKSGFGVLMYDTRDEGASADAVSTRGWLEVNDVLGAVDYLQKRSDVDPNRIGAFGFSLGGQITLRAAITTPQIHAVAVDGASTATFEDEPPPDSLWNWLNYLSSWVFYKGIALTTGVAEPHSIISQIASISPRPVLFIAAGKGPEYRWIKRYYETAKTPKAIWLIPEAAHGEGIFKRPEEYKHRVIAFFNDALLGTDFERDKF